LLFLVIKMNKMETEFLAAIKAGWKEEIERPIDKLKRPRRTAIDKWFRKQFYRAKWRMRNVKGPRVERN